MKKRKLVWHLYPSYLIIILITLLVVIWYTPDTVRRFFYERTQMELKAQAELIENTIRQYPLPPDPILIERICHDVAALSIIRLTVILPNGLVVGDSQESTVEMGNHRNRPEVKRALSGKDGYAVRYSDTLKENMVYAAIPLLKDSRVAAVIRTSLPATAIERKLFRIRIEILLGGFLIAVLACIKTLFVSRRVTRPIEEMRKGAEHFVKGDLRRRLRIPDSLELAGLAESMNEVAVQLENRIETVITQRNEYQAVLSSLTEGVIAVDREENIISVNQAAAVILGLGHRWAELKGRSIQELTRSLALQQFVADTLTEGKLVEGDIVLYDEDEKERIVQTQSVPLRDGQDQRIGTLLVLNDVTHVRQLENMRRDFVANVSHEIKTPLTAIKGFVETLHHGAVEDPEETNRFFEIITKHVDRLNAIVEDLLSLARIEQQNGQQDIQLEKLSLADVIQAAVQVVQPKADEKKIQIEVMCPEPIFADLDRTLIDQALVNLIDNAVKYSPESTRVRLKAYATDTALAISVTDEGPGIPKKHLPRLFERFYRVDKARSRKMGGTGLGLAIVKHAIQAHRGQVSVESTLGKGTTFEIRLPRVIEGAQTKILTKS